MLKAFDDSALFAQNQNLTVPKTKFHLTDNLIAI